jgi:hypothetical protein
MRFDRYVFARMLNWNPTLNWLDREAVISAWRKSVNFDLWWAGKVIARAETMWQQGFVEVLGDDGHSYKWKKTRD